MKKFILSALLTVSSIAFAGEDYLFFSSQARASHLKGYTAEEQAAIEKDLEVVRSLCLSDDVPTDQGKPIYLATAGAPGSRKSTILEGVLKSYPQFAHMAYIDPDQRALKFMVNTYYQSLAALAIAGYQDYALATKAAYEKWRGGSNYIALTLLEESFAQRRNIAHGTTCTGAHIPEFLSKVKEAGYEVVLLLCSCEDSFRGQAIEYRNTEQKFYQCTAEDAVNKGTIFPQRMPAYFSYADQLYFFWSDDLQTPECLAATIIHGHLNVMDQEAFNKFVHKFEVDRISLQKEGIQLPCWQELIDTACLRQTR